MRRVRLQEEAIIEAMEAAAWYESECTGLGLEFAEAIETALDLLEADIVPLAAMPGELGKCGLKRLVLKRFPYDVVVLERAQELLVLAIAHHARYPGYWQGSIKLL